MKKENKEIKELLATNHFNVCGNIGNQDGEYYLEIERSTPAGEDWLETIWFDGSLKGFADALTLRANTFDIDDEVEPYLSQRGKGGCPSSIKELIEDAEWKKNELIALGKAFQDAVDTMELMPEDRELQLSDFQVGQPVRYYTEDPFEHPIEHTGVVKEIHEDHLLVDIPDISGHVWFEPGLNLDQLVLIPASAEQIIAEKVWLKFFAPFYYTEEDHARIVSQLTSEFDNCGEDAFMMRSILDDISSRPAPATLCLRRDSFSDKTWSELASAFQAKPSDLKECVVLHAYLDKNSSYKKLPEIS